MPPTQRTSKMTRWRAASLIAVYVLAVIHFLHWKLNGWTLAPVEPSEMFDTLHLGVITVGFLFMVGVVIATAIAGRFFCSWGCHILALQDLSAWILRKLHIPTKPIRSRTLAWVPPLAVVYLFVWPQVERLLEGKPLPKLHVVTDADGWSSYFTTDLLRSFPGLGMTLFTFAVVGFAIVYFLGSRSFCSYACPYGAIFAVADRVSPLRIVAGDGPCTKCGACVASCPSNVRVIEEVDKFGAVVNANCMKDLDCVSVCPTNALAYGVAKPPVLRSWWKPPGLRKTYDFTLREDLLMAALFLVLLVIFRGLYDAFSFLLSLAMASIVAYFCVVAIRLWRSEPVALGHLQLKNHGQLTPAGKWTAAGLLLLGVLVVHSGWVQFHTLAGKSYMARLATPTTEMAKPGDAVDEPGARSTDLSRAIHHFEQAAQWGLVCPRGLRVTLATLYRQAGDTTGARNQFNTLLSIDPSDYQSRLQLAWLWVVDGRPEIARRLAEEVLSDVGDARDLATQMRNDKTASAAQYLLGDIAVRSGERGAAIDSFQQSIELYPKHAQAHLSLGSLLAADQQLDQAALRFATAAKLSPQSAAAHNNLAAVLVQLNRKAEALEHYQRAVELMPEDPVAAADAGTLLLELDRIDEAEQMFKKALSRQADDAVAQEGMDEISRRRQRTPATGR